MTETDKKREQRNAYYRKWRRDNPEAQETILLRSWARKIFSLPPERLAEILTPPAKRGEQ